MIKYPHLYNNFNSGSESEMFYRRRKVAPPSKIIPSKSAAKLLSYLASSAPSSSSQHKATTYKTTTTTTTPSPPSPVLWMPGGDADCGGSDQIPSTIGTFSLLALILSIFNVINLLATNSNNNNNRNNINDNLGNVNSGSNTESNANSNGMTATQVMMVPPGVGKRRRRRNAEKTYSTLTAQLSTDHQKIHLNLTLSNLEPPIHNTFNLADGIETLQDELFLAAVMILNSYHLFEMADVNVTSFDCHQRNFCEMGINSRFFGDDSAALASLVSPVLSRWVATTDEEESKISQAIAQGTNLENCGELYKNCRVRDWNEHIQSHRTKAWCS